MRFLRFLVCIGASFLSMTSGRAQSSVVMSGKATVVAVTPTVTASSAYSSGNVVGGVMTFSNIFRTGGGSGVLASCLVVDRSNSKPALTILLYSKNPSNGTYTDNSAFVFDSTDAVNLVRTVTVASTDWVTLGAYAVADVGAIGKVVYNGESQAASVLKNLYAVAVTTGTPTFNAATNLTFKVGVLQD